MLKMWMECESFFLHTNCKQNTSEISYQFMYRTLNVAVTKNISSTTIAFENSISITESTVVFTIFAKFPTDFILIFCTSKLFQGKGKQIRHPKTNIFINIKIVRKKHTNSSPAVHLQNLNVHIFLIKTTYKYHDLYTSPLHIATQFT